MDKHDRRQAHRYGLKIPLEVELSEARGAQAQETESLDISGRGVRFASTLPLKAGTALKLLLRMPETIVRKAAGDWLCHCRVVYVKEEQDPNGQQQAGVEIQYYEILKRAEKKEGMPLEETKEDMGRPGQG